MDLNGMIGYHALTQIEDLLEVEINAVVIQIKATLNILMKTIV